MGGAKIKKNLSIKSIDMDENESQKNLIQRLIDESQELRAKNQKLLIETLKIIARSQALKT
jgi:hypothetical protein